MPAKMESDSAAGSCLSDSLGIFTYSTDTFVLIFSQKFSATRDIQSSHSQH